MIGIIIAILVSWLPRLENAMDRVYCGEEIAKHNYKWYDIVAAVFFIGGVISFFK